MTTFLELLAAFGVGGILGQYVSKASERRAARADVRRAISDVENAWWRIPTEGEEDTFAELRALMAAAIVAQVPRLLVETYIYAAQATRVARISAHRERPASEAGNLVGIGIRA